VIEISKKCKKFFIIILFLLIIPTTFGTIGVFLIHQNNYPESSEENDVNPQKIIQQLTYSITNSQEMQLNSVDFTWFLKTFILNKNIKFQNYKLENINIKIHDEENKITLYFLIKNENKLLNITIESMIKFENNNIILMPENIKFGELPIPKSVFLYILNRKLPENIKLQDNQILIPAEIVESKVLKNNISIKIQELSTKDNFIKIKISNLNIPILLKFFKKLSYT